MSRFLHLAIAILLLAVPALAADEPRAFPFHLSDSGQTGVSDASIAATQASERAWLSYSALNPSAVNPRVNARIATTRLAYSDNGGADWQDFGANVNTATAPSSAKPIDWTNETSSLLYDPVADASERWKLFWHHYPVIDGEKKIEHGWIAYKAAPTPDQLPQAPEIKLFAAAQYDPVNDAAGWTASPLPATPALHADRLAPALHKCAAFNEPAALVTPKALYLALGCAEPRTAPEGYATKTILLRCKQPCHATGPEAWEYVSTLLTVDDAALIGYRGFAAPDLYSKNGRFYLMISPTLDRPVRDTHQGCLIFRFTDIATGTLDRGDTPTIIARLSGTKNSFNGACTYQASIPAAGIIYGEIENLDTNPAYKLFTQSITLP